MTLYEALLQAAVREPGAPALIGNGETLSYAELRDRVGRLSNLYQAEFPRGARVALLSENGAFFAQSLFAVSNSGATLLLLDPEDSDESIVADLKALQVKFLLISGTQLGRARELLRRERLSLTLIEIERRRAGEYDTSFRALPERAIKDSDPFLVIRQESAPSGRRYSAFSHAQVLASVNSVKLFYRLTPSDRMLATMGWSHPFSLSHGLLLPLFSGATAVVDPKLGSVEEFVEFLATVSVTRFAGSPKFFFQLLTFCAARKYTLPGVKSITVGMGSLSLALRKTYKLLKIPVLRCYGRREGVWSLAMDELDSGLDMESSRTRPAPGVRFAVLTEDGEEIPGPGRREGRLAVMCEALSPGYFAAEREEQSMNPSFRGTWLHTDEVGRLEGKEDSLSVAVLGKISDMLLEEGTYLSPRRIDEAASRLDGVEEAAGFVKLRKNKEPVFACALVMKAGKYNERDLLESLQNELPDEFRPDSVHIVNSLPRDSFDSVNRGALQRQFSQL